MGHSTTLRLLALMAFVIFLFAAYMEHQTGNSVYFFVAGLAVFSSIIIRVLMKK